MGHNTCQCDFTYLFFPLTSNVCPSSRFPCSLLLMGNFKFKFDGVTCMFFPKFPLSLASHTHTHTERERDRVSRYELQKNSIFCCTCLRYIALEDALVRPPLMWTPAWLLAVISLSYLLIYSFPYWF